MSSLLNVRAQHHSADPYLLKINKKEVSRYLGYYNVSPDERTDSLIDKCIQEELEACNPQSIYSVYPIERTGSAQGLNLGFAQVLSKDLEKNLNNCEYIILFAATIGPKIDQLILRASRTNPLKAVILQATGAMLIESYCNLLNEQLRKDAEAAGFRLRPRFSPGYGDFSLAHQKDIFNHLPASKTIGLTLMDSGIMAPSKSVTAVIGMYHSENNVSPDYLPGCSMCDECKKCPESEEKIYEQT